jgi:hypothetical protein
MPEERDRTTRRQLDDGQSPEAIDRATERTERPVDGITRVTVADSYSYR